MSHYWTSDDSPEIRRAQAEDWIEDLIEFGPDVAAVAIGEWRRTQTKRPTPADVRRLAIAEQRRRAERGEHEELRALPPLDREERYARSVGWSSAAERRDAIVAQKRREEAGFQWQREHAAELKAGPAGAFRRVGEHSWTPEEMRSARIALGLESEEADNAV